jgi:hypothetical protein
MTIRKLAAAAFLLSCPGTMLAQGPRHLLQALDLQQDAARIVPAPKLPPAGRVTGNAVLGASLGLVIGVVGGAFAGAALEGGSCSDQCGLFGAINGAAVGPTLAVPVGLHLAGANRHVVESLAISALVAAVGMAALPVDNQTASVLAIPCARLLIALIAKR